MKYLNHHKDDFQIEGLPSAPLLDLSSNGKQMVLSFLEEIVVVGLQKRSILLREKKSKQRVLLSPSGVFLASTSATGTELEIWNLEERKSLVKFNSKEENYRTSPMNFSGDILIYSIDNGSLCGWDCRNEKWLFQLEPEENKKVNLVQSIVSVGEEYLCLTVYPGQGNPNDFVVLNKNKLTSPSISHYLDVALPKEEVEYSARFTFSANGQDSLAFYQDFDCEQEELDEEDDEYNGFFIRTLPDLKRNEEVPAYFPSAEDGAPVMATESYFLLGLRDRVEVWSRPEKNRIASIPALSESSWFPTTFLYDFVPESSQVVICKGNGNFSIIHLA